MDNSINSLPNRDTSASSNTARFVAIIVLVLTLIASVSFHIKADSQTSLKRLETTSQLLIATEQVQRNLDEYLLSGAASCLEQLSKNRLDLQDAMEKLRDVDSSPETRRELNSFSNAYQAWSLQVAQPLIQKRKDVDAGNSTLVEMHIFYLSQDPGEKSNALENAAAKIQRIEMGTAQN